MKFDLDKALSRRPLPVPVPEAFTPRAITPHEKLRQLDIAGDAYVIKFALVGDLANVERADVLSHSERWICARPVTGGEERWISTAAIAWIEIEEL